MTPITPQRCSICDSIEDIASAPDSRYNYCPTCIQHAAGALYHLLTPEQTDRNPFLTMLALAIPYATTQDSLGMWDMELKEEVRKPIPPQIQLWMRVYVDHERATKVRAIQFPIEGIFSWESIKLIVDK